MKKGLYFHPLMGQVKIQITSQYKKNIEYEPKNKSQNDNQQYMRVYKILKSFKLKYIYLPQVIIYSSRSNKTIPAQSLGYQSCIQNQDIIKAQQNLLNNFIPHKFNALMRQKQQNYKFIYQFYPITLRQQIQNRSKNNISFSFKQIVYLMFHLIQLGIQIIQIKKQVQSVFFGNTINSACFLFSQKGKIKFVDFYSGMFMLSDIQHHQAPQKINIKQRDSYLKQNPEPSVSFNIGMIIAEILTLTNAHYFYNHQTDGFQQQKFKQKINQASQEYGILKQITKLLCEINSGKRLKLTQAQFVFSIYSQMIHQKNQNIQFDKEQIQQSLKNVLMKRKSISV